MRHFAIKALLFLVPLLPASAQRLSPRSSFLLNVDYARFHNSATSGYLELYYAFYPALTTVDRQTDGTFQGWIRVWTQLRDKATGNLLVNDLNALPITVRDTSQRTANVTTVSHVGYTIPFGAYVLDIVAYDSLNTARKDSIRLSVDVVPYSGASISDLQLCSSIKEDQGSGPFVKNTLEVIPNATLLFGVTSHPVVFHYVELYSVETGRPYALKSSILDAKGKVVRQTTRLRTFTVANSVDVGTFNVSSFPSGKYTLQIRVLRDTLEEVASTRKAFYINNPHVQIQSASATSVKASEMAGLTFDELGMEFDAARYLAGESELEAFKKLTTADARREFLAGFWTSVEKGRNGIEGLTRLEYQQRIVGANQRFRVHGRDGWRTDRGRVFLLFGDADEIERVPSTEDSKPYEIWHYYQIEQGVMYIFIDRTGFGDYILAHSTKRGELQDESWQRMLR